MSFIEKGQSLPQEINEKTMAGLVACALRQEYAGARAAIKRIETATGISQNCVRKWYRGSNAPESVHLLELARIYPCVLRMILELIGRSDVWDACVRNSIPQKMQAEHSTGHLKRVVYYDKFVVIGVIVNLMIGCQLNQRQLWFLGRLQQGHKVKVDDISAVWRVHFRTAQRDITGLRRASLIRLAGVRREGCYELV